MGQWSRDTIECEDVVMNALQLPLHDVALNNNVCVWFVFIALTSLDKLRMHAPRLHSLGFTLAQ